MKKIIGGGEELSYNQENTHQLITIMGGRRRGGEGGEEREGEEREGEEGEEREEEEREEIKNLILEQS